VDPVPTRPLKKMDSKKSMLTTMRSCYAFLALDDLPKGLKMNSRYFCDVVLEEVKRTVIAITVTKKSGIEEVMIHMDNCRVHNSAKTAKGLAEFHVTRLHHPPYSPDVSPCDFWFFGWNKNLMQGQKFHGPDDVRVFLLDLWLNLDPSTLISVCYDWTEGLEHVIVINGECYST
jgi:histone-lysine N-methyltransferase SETMAR